MSDTGSTYTVFEYDAENDTPSSAPIYATVNREAAITFCKNEHRMYGHTTAYIVVGMDFDDKGNILSVPKEEVFNKEEVVAIEKNNSESESGRPNGVLA